MRSRRRPRLSRRVAAVLLGAALLAGSPVAAECDPAGLDSLLSPGRILLLGEIHGTEEGPAIVGEAACATADEGLPVVVVLEIPHGEQEAIEAFLASDGGEEAIGTLLGREFWQRGYQDGRSSAAMLALIDDLRSLRSAGNAVSVRTIDTDERLPTSQDRDGLLGRGIVEAVETAGSDAVVLALLGNVHSRTTPGVPWDDGYRPAGIVVESRWPDRTLSLLFTNPPGEAWTCDGATPDSCRARALGGSEEGEPGRVELFPTPRDGHEGSFRLPSLTASSPAVASTESLQPAKTASAEQAAPAVPAIEPHPRLRPFSPLVGPIWAGSFPGGELVDEQRFEWVYGGKFLRNVHQVKNPTGEVVYEGETIYAWDPTSEEIVWWYWNTTGGFITGTLTEHGGSWLAEGTNHAPPPQPTEVRSELRIGDGSWESVSYFPKDGEWTERFRITFRPRE